MKTCCDRIACAMIRQPSSSRCGTRSMISRSLNVPGSDSSAFTVRYVGLPLSAGMKLAFFPVAKNAPPRPRRLAVFSSSITHCGSCARALASASKPPTARYSASFVRSWSSAPPRTTSGWSGTAELLHDRRDVAGLHRPAVIVVDCDDRRPAAAAEALDGAEGELAVLGRLAGPHAELPLERLEDGLGTAERAADVRAHLDQMPADRAQVEHV